MVATDKAAENSGLEDAPAAEIVPERRERSSENNTNGAPNLNNVHQRLQALEKKLEALLKPKYGDSWFSSYFLGRDGRNNGQGIVGPPGPPGPPGKDAFHGKSGIKYVRWGRTTCPGGAQIVYKGLMGGGNYNHQGGGVNYLCLPSSPKYDKYKNGHQSAGYVYGVEYEVSSFNPFKKSLHDHDAPCVVCFVKSRGAMLMMPARNECPTGWTEEYHGYLMTAFHNHRKQYDFICVDEDAEARPGTRANKNGALLYPVEGVCGSLPCHPYVAGREFTCAVCTK